MKPECWRNEAACLTPLECQLSRNCLGGLDPEEGNAHLVEIRALLKTPQYYNRALQELASQCSTCKDCPHSETAGQSVFDRGDPASSLVFIGEAPGETDDQEGKLYVGETGRLLDKMIARIKKEAESWSCKHCGNSGFSGRGTDYGSVCSECGGQSLRSSIDFPAPYITNVLKHWPPDGKLMKSGEDVRACTPKLYNQLNVLPNVRVIVTLGKVATHALLGVNTPIGKLRGRSFHNSRTGDKLVWTDDRCGEDLPNSSSEWRDPNRRIVVVPTWHPAYLNHQPNRMEPRQQCWSDLQLALQLLRDGDR